jgi:hypothetical protein
MNRGPIEVVIYLYLLGGSKEIGENHNKDSRWPGRDSNGNLLNVSLERYLYTSLLGLFFVARLAQRNDSVSSNIASYDFMVLLHLEWEFGQL